MTLGKPNQYLHSDLQILVDDLKWSAVELMGIAVRLSEAGSEHDAQVVIRACQTMHAVEEKLAGYGDAIGFSLPTRAEEG